MEPIEEHICLNSKCKSSSSASWKRGWHLRSGLHADLCESCGLAFEESRFCETFHVNDSGWRTCTMCGKRVHCGCIASTNSYVLLDTGGVTCTSCTKEGLLIMQGRQQLDNRVSSPIFPQKLVSDQIRTQLNEIVARAANAEVVQRHSKGFQEVCTPISVGAGNTGSLDGRVQKKALLCTSSDTVRVVPDGDNACQDLIAQEKNIKIDDVSEANRHTVALEMMVANSNVSLELENLASSFGSMSRDIWETIPSHSGVSLHRSRQRQILPHPPTSSVSVHKEAVIQSETAGDPPGLTRAGRAHGEGKGRSQLLPRYMPRITDQEMTQIMSGDENAIFTPLFEKMLSASDAGRIGRLVLPKACAEAYFPSISVPEGQPLDIHDITGKKWTFQFRYWPNNNSRMYVLEGVTPCIQHMGLQAGDTVTFSRLDPEGKLVMGYRKASASSSQDPHATPRSVRNAHRHPDLQSMSSEKEGSVGNNLNRSIALDAGYGWSKSDKMFSKEKGSAIIQALLLADKKRGRPLGSKSKRLRIDSDDALELKTTWEEAQELLRPPPGVVPSIVTIDGHEFEEYEDPPVLSKQTIFTTGESGEQDQWIQCDDCLKWRKVPFDAVVHTRWTCSDNHWDQQRATCSSPREVSELELSQLSFTTASA
ncbi:hypothetical protein O6H91_19G016500 [Diphasiastrum complanatum]|uniref:Uncharacterized protein n=1 Tax=Diphasiastrum complanatum TaxID=34168 RepID=A0ACC2AT29_DIPCM|nr:hypothetical protein O6H91_19G016500 [Diphasiastrum complanatum]